MTLDKRELGSVLAGLRLLQHYWFHGTPPDKDQLKAIYDIAGDGNDCLTPEDLDELCERLNAGR